MNIKKTIIGALLLFIAAPSFAQRTENVHGVFTYTVGEDETFSIAEMRHKCIVGAQNEAIKEKFNDSYSPQAFYDDYIAIYSDLLKE